AHPDRTHDQDVVVRFEEAQRGELTQECTVEADLGRLVPVLELGLGIEVRFVGTKSDGHAVPTLYLVLEHEEEQILMGHLLLASQSEAFGKRVQHPRELQASQHGFEVRGDRVGGHAGSPFLACGDRMGSAYWWAGRR